MASSPKFRYRPIPEGGIETTIPQGEMDVKYQFVFYNSLQKFTDIIFDMRSYSDPRIEAMAEFFMSIVTDTEVFVEIKRRFEDFKEEEIAAEKQRLGTKDLDLDNERKALCTYRATTRVIHEVVSWFDIFTGITHPIVIGEI
jgi:hypothetical protein